MRPCRPSNQHRSSRGPPSAYAPSHLQLSESIFPNSNFLLLFVFFYLFVLSLLALAILLSSIFNSAKLASALSSGHARHHLSKLRRLDPGVSSSKKQAVCIL